MVRQWLIRAAQMIWEVLQNPRNRSLWWRRIRRGCGIILLLILLFSCLSCILLGVLVGRAGATGPDTGLDVLLVVDNSNSMFDKGGMGSDPDLRRIEAAHMFINYLGVDSGPVSHRLGVVFFGGQAQLVVPLTPLADQARRAGMETLIADPQRMDWTDPASALTLARDTLLAGTGDGHQPVVILLTDGKPEWDSDPNEVEQQSVIEELRHIGRRYASDEIRLFVILLTNEATDADPEIGTTYGPLWRELVGATGGCFYPVRRADDLITVYHDILVTLSGVQTAGPVVEAEIEGETQVEVVTIEPNLARVTFVVRVSGPGASTGLSAGASTGLPSAMLGAGSTGVTVTVHRPDGRALKAGDADVRHAAQATTAIWAVTRPQPGDWAVVMTGQGSVTVWKDYLPAPVTPTPSPVPTLRAEPQSEAAIPSPTPAPQMIVDEWPEVILLGQPVTLSLAFEPAPPEPPIVWAEWVVGDGQPGRERLLDDGHEGDAQAGDGRYGASLTPASAGILLVRVWGEVRGHEIASWEGRLRVEPYPTLELVVPEDRDTWRAGRPVVVETHWAVDGETLAMGGPLTATLRSSDGIAHTVLTGSVGESIVLPAPQVAGTYSLTVEASGGFSDPSPPPLGPPQSWGGSRGGESTGSLPFWGEATATVVVRRPLPGWVWMAGVGLPLAGLGGWGLHRWFQRLPRVAGRLRVLEAPAGYAGPTLTDLSSLNRQSVRLGGAQAELPLPAEGSFWATIRALPDGSGVELTPCNGQVVQINEHPLAGPHLLSDGDRIATEGVRLRYEHLHYGL